MYDPLFCFGAIGLGEQNITRKCRSLNLTIQFTNVANSDEIEKLSPPPIAAQAAENRQKEDDRDL